MHGGSRKGAGRKRAEPTVRISVPKGLLEDVKKMILAHKSGSVVTTKISLPNSKPQEKKQPLDKKNSVSVNPSVSSSDLIQVRKELERLPSHVRKRIQKVHGSLFNAAKDGVRAMSGGVYIPPQFQARY